MNDFAVDTSLKERLARRREELRRNRVIDIPVPGYEKELVARYIPLDYHTLRRIGKRAENQQDEIQAEIDLAADTLVNACEGIYEKKADDEGLAPTGYKWGTKAAVELFGLPVQELSENPTAREAILAIFPSDTLVVGHYLEYSRQTSTAQDEVETQLQGESRAS